MALGAALSAGRGVNRMEHWVKSRGSSCGIGSSIDCGARGE